MCEKCQKLNVLKSLLYDIYDFIALLYVIINQGIIEMLICFSNPIY